MTVVSDNAGATPPLQNPSTPGTPGRETLGSSEAPITSGGGDSFVADNEPLLEVKIQNAKQPVMRLTKDCKGVCHCGRHLEQRMLYSNSHGVKTHCGLCHHCELAFVFEQKPGTLSNPLAPGSRVESAMYVDYARWAREFEARKQNEAECEALKQQAKDASKKFRVIGCVVDEETAKHLAKLSKPSFSKIGGAA